MGSINAQTVARKVLANVSKGKKVNMSEIVAEAGYGRTISRVPNKVTNTKSYKLAIEMESKPLIEGLQKEISKIKASMALKNTDKEEYRVLAGTLDVLIRNYQLLSGGATERQVFVLPSEVMSKNNIQQSQDDVKTIDGSVEPSNDVSTT